MLVCNCNFSPVVTFFWQGPSVNGKSNSIKLKKSSSANGKNLGLPNEEIAAIRIQTAFRAYVVCLITGYVIKKVNTGYVCSQMILWNFVSMSLVWLCLFGEQFLVSCFISNEDLVILLNYVAVWSFLASDENSNLSEGIYAWRSTFCYAGFCFPKTFSHPLQARKALRRLKGIVRLQILTQAYPVTKQATTTLSYLHSWSRIQDEIRARRLYMVTEGRIKQKKLENQHKLEAKLHDIEVRPPAPTSKNMSDLKCTIRFCKFLH